MRKFLEFPADIDYIKKYFNEICKREDSNIIFLEFLKTYFKNFVGDFNLLEFNSIEKKYKFNMKQLVDNINSDSFKDSLYIEKNLFIDFLIQLGDELRSRKS